MREARWLLAPLALTPALLPAFACARDDVAAIGLVMKAPQGILDDATSVSLTVVDAEVAPCLASGRVEVRSGEGQRFDLERTGCAAGVAWCKEIQLDKDETTKTFAVVASSAAGTLGEGCAIATIDQDPLEVAIKIQRYNPPACCNDGALQAGEQCECGLGSTVCSSLDAPQCGGITADDVCEATCLAKEIPVDRRAADAAPAPGTTRQLSMAFCPGDQNIPNALRAAYTDTTPAAKGGSDVAVRVLDDELYPLAASSPLGRPRYLPLLCSDIDGPGRARQQLAPSIAPISTDLTAIVYTSDEATGASFDVFLSPQATLGCRDQSGADPAAAQLNTTGTSASDPDVAGGPNGSGLAVWTENGQIHGRIFVQATGASPPWTLVPESGDLVIATSASLARVAGSTQGWVVVYQGAGTDDGDGVFVKRIDPSGGIGAEARVNAATQGAQDQPDVAALSDGRFVVAFRSGGDVFAQRFDAFGGALPGDQDAPLHEATDGEQAHPAAAGYGSVFAIAWEDADRGGISARFLGAEGGSLYNSVNGQNVDFDASQPGVAGTRRLPAVAIGGAGFVAIGWQDVGGSPGIYVRRFPLPTQ
jgi:hypothetical protein